MKTQKITRTFPDVEPKGLNAEIFRSKIYNAVKDYLRVLKKEKVPYTPKTIYRPQKDEMLIVKLDFPFYDNWDHKWAETTLKEKGIAEFFQYVWERGELRRTLTGPDPQRKEWELFVLRDVIHSPLSSSLNSESIERYIDSGEIEHYHISDSNLNIFCDEIVTQYCNNKKKYIAKCPIGYIERGACETYTLGENITLRLLSEREKASYLTHVHHKTSWQDPLSRLSFNNNAILEIIDFIDLNGFEDLRPRKTLSGIVEEALANIIDITKWSFSVVFNTLPLIEGTITYQDIFGGNFHMSSIGAFKREEKVSGTVYKIKNEKLNKVQELISKAKRYSEISDDFKNSLWYWGRTCHSNLDRDILLDSIIGLENLLVANPGESRYRFGLHGAALLSDLSDPDKTENIARELKKLYDRRSRVAHGKREERMKEASLARRTLGDAIHDILECYEAGSLNPEKKTSKQIELSILRRSPIRNG